ncbi:MAG: PKD domain-containing protein [Bacteroidales bacterium]|jgi:PKD repeat protein
MKKQILLLTSVFFLFAGVSCYKKVAVPVADFSIQSSNDSIVPDTLTFRNLSQNASSYEWNFGDSHSSTETNPVHIYTVAGNYTIVLKAYSGSREQWATKSRIINIE